MVNPIFLPIVPDRNPRTECGCQPVTFISSSAVAPPGRLSRSRHLVGLAAFAGAVAFFAPLGAFLAGVAFLADLAFFFATLARRGATRGLFGGFRLALGGRSRGGRRFFCNRNHVFSLGGDYRDHDIHHSGGLEKQVDSAGISQKAMEGDG